MAPVLAQRCLHHASREAVARCPECGQFFCRECIVEHENRVICAGCLARLAAAPAPRRSAWRAAGPLAGAATGFFLTWLVFYVIGRMLLAVPDDVHASKL